MGYYTTHELEVIHGNTDINHEECISAFVDHLVFEGEVKWYNMEADMKKYSSKHPPH